jgi:hypothetical protein
VWAACVNGAQAHALDFDDTHIPSLVHGSASVAPVVLAVGEWRRVSGAETLAAFVAGFEVETRLGNVGNMRSWPSPPSTARRPSGCSAARRSPGDARTRRAPVRLRPGGGHRGRGPLAGQRPDRRPSAPSLRAGALGPAPSVRGAAMPDTFSWCRARTARVGVFPRGPQVRRRSGAIRKPVSSRQISRAPKQ